MYCAEKKKSVSKSHTLYDSIYMIVPEKAELQGQKENISSCHKLKKGERVEHNEAAGRDLGGDGTVLYFNCGGCYMSMHLLPPTPGHQKTEFTTYKLNN